MFSQAAPHKIDIAALFQASPNPYVLIDRDLRIAGMNAAYLQVTMRTADSLLGRPLFEAFPSDPASVQGQQVRQSLARVMADQRPDHIPLVHYPIARPDGTLEDRFWSATHVPVMSNQGELAFVLQHTEDITELTRLRAREGLVQADATASVLRRADALQSDNLALGEERDRLRQMFEQAPGFMAVMHGPQHTLVTINRAYQQLVGHDRPLLGRHVRDALPDIEGQGFFELLDQVYRSGEPYVGHDVQIELQRAPGATRESLFVDFVYQPLRQADGQVTGIFVQGHDNTAREVARRESLANESRFRALTQAMPNQVWTALPNGLLDWANDQTYQYAGRGPAEVLGSGWTSMVHADDLAPAAAAWQQALASGQPYSTEFRLRRHDHIYRWHIARAVPMHDQAGAVAYWIGTNTDIHDQKAGAALLADLNNELARRVEERSAELMQVQEVLRQSQKMEAIGNLAGGIAHDFNNLLQVVGGNLHLLARELSGQPQAEARVANALAGVTRGARLAAQLLAFGRRQPLAPEVVNVGRLIRGMDDILRGSLGQAIQIDTVIAGGLWNTLVDPGNVENALLNLALNARDAMDGQGQLTIEAGNAFLDDDYALQHAEVQAGQYVMIAVTDTGSGMTPQVLERVFEPFFSTKPEGKGTGLGLPMVYGFVKQSGGHVKLYSEPGIGTTVRLYLPRSTAAEDLHPVPRAADEAEAAATSRASGGETVLVVEDDEAVRNTTVALLVDLGYRVLKARDAESALTIVDSGATIDVLFTDVVMPGALKSTELARKAKLRLPGLAVLYTSGYTENAIVHGGRLDAGVQLLSKPYTRDALARKLLHVLALEQPARGADTTTSTALRVLVCEDDTAVRETVAELLQGMDCQVQQAADAAQARALLAAGGLDLLLTDLGLPGEGGLSLALWARAQQADLSVAFASGSDARDALAAVPGALLLAKPFDAEGLERLVAASMARLAARLKAQR